MVKSVSYMTSWDENGLLKPANRPAWDIR